jgi:ubiquinone/menaquinone biosynthesis C-methylase UbiE
MVYKEWEQFDGDKVVATSPFSEKVFDFIPRGERVLDLGCGNGRISKIIKEHGYLTYGMDVNAGAIALAQSNPDLASIEFSVQDAKATNYATDFFDGLIEQAVLACMEKPDRSIVLNEARRILKPGGIFSIAEFGIREDKKEKYEVDATITGEYGTRIIKKEDGSEWYRSHNFRRDELEGLIQDAGFEIIHETHPDFHTLRGNVHPGHQYIVRKV